METLKLTLLALFLNTRELPEFNVNSCNLCALGYSPIVFPVHGLKEYSQDLPNLDMWQNQYYSFYELTPQETRILFGGTYSDYFNRTRAEAGYKEYNTDSKDQYLVAENILKFIKDKKFTLSNFTEVVRGECFAKGEIYFPTDEWPVPIRWLAKRGAVEDWAMYMLPLSEDPEWDRIRTHGTKISKEMASQIIHCTEEVTNLYRS